MHQDNQFFAQHPDRKARIRRPATGEEEVAFRSLGPHNRDRRRIIVVRVPDGPHKGLLMPIPFLLFSTETVEDRDDILMPIVNAIMLDARRANDNR